MSAMAGPRRKTRDFLSFRTDIGHDDKLQPRAASCASSIVYLVYRTAARPLRRWRGTLDSGRETQQAHDEAHGDTNTATRTL